MKPKSLRVELARGTGTSASISLPFDVTLAETSDALSVEEEVTRLFDQLRTPLLRYLLSMGLSSADGDEIVQESFLALFQHLRHGRPRTNLRGWVFRTAHNQGLKRRHRNRRTQGLAAADGAAERAPDQRPNPEQQLSARQREMKMLAIMRALPAQDRSCLNLRAEGLRYREIAHVLGRSLGSVSISIRRSLARLKQADR